MRTELDALTKARDSLRSEARDMKARLEVTSPEAIDAKIAELEVRRALLFFSLFAEREKRGGGMGWRGVCLDPVRLGGG